MATRTLNRRALRDQADTVVLDEREQDLEARVEDGNEAAPKTKTRKRATKTPTPPKPKAPAKPRVRKKAVKVPTRLIARWAVCDNSAKRVAVFEYKDRAGADAKLSDVRERKPGTYYLALVKDPFDPPVESAPTLLNA